MTTPDQYPSVTIVAGDIRQARPISPDYGALLRMHDGATYISISPETARQWLPVLQTIAGEK